MKRKTVLLLLFAVVLLLLFAVSSFGQEFTEEGYLIIKAEPEMPLALVTLTRTRPEFASMGIKKDASNVPISFERKILAPAPEELQPKKMEDLKTLLAKERR